MFFMPETPYHLITKNKEDEAMKSLQWLRGNKNIKTEMEDLKRANKQQMLLGKVTYNNLLRNSVYSKPFLIMTTLMLIQQFSGVNAVMFNLKV